MSDVIPYTMRVAMAAEILKIDPVELQRMLDAKRLDQIRHPYRSSDPNRQWRRDAMMNYQEAAEFLRTTVNALRAQVHRGTIPYVRWGPRTVRFDPEQLRRGN